MGDAVSMPRLEAASSAGSQIMASREVTESHPAVVPSHPRIPPWLLAAMLLGTAGGGGSIAAGLGSIGGGDAVRDMHIEEQKRRLDAHDDAIKSLASEQNFQNRWMADQLTDQAQALTDIAEKVGAQVRIKVEPFQSGGM